MRIHHLNCGSMNPPMMKGVVCHVLLCETEDGLALVDSGLGRADFADPKRMGPARLLLRPDRKDEFTAAAQIEKLGHSTDDIKHIVLTHMDFDHIGGIADFAAATIHTTAEEYDWAVTNPDFASKQRYSQKQWSHNPPFETHAGPGEAWKFDLHGMPVLPGITLIPMPGHTKGHAAVAVEPGDGSTLIHAGDAVFDASSYGASAGGKKLDKVGMFRTFEKAMAWDRKRLAGNHETLARLDGIDGVRVFNAHDRRVFAEFAS